VERPTNEQVQWALKDADRGGAFDGTNHWDRILAAEVRVLRATIERIRPVETWRCRCNDHSELAGGEPGVEQGMDIADLRCADELAAALKDVGDTNTLDTSR
jgi:hypothetical protein